MPLIIGFYYMEESVLLGTKPLVDSISHLSNVKCQMYVYSGHALSYIKLVHRHATETEGNKYFK